MKKETLRRQWLLYGSGLDWQLGAVAVFWLLIEGITAVALAITKETTTVILSAMICLILLAFVSVFTGFQRVNRVLTLGIALGSTRRAEVLRCAAWHLGGALASAALLFGLNGLSHLIYRLAYAPRGIVLDMDGLALLPTGEWLLILLAPVLLSICVAATVNTFGPKGYWVVWLLWMLICFSPNSLIKLYKTSPAALWAVLALAAVLLLGWTAWSVRRLLRWTVQEL